MPAMVSTHAGHPNCAISPAGRMVRAAIAARDASNQFDASDRAVKPRLAPRRPFLQGLAQKIGRAASIRAPIPITARMMVALLRNWRAVIVSPPRVAIV